MSRLKPYTRPRIHMGWLLAALVILCGAFASCQYNGSLEPSPWYAQQLAASRRMQSAEQALLQYITQENIPIEPEDINRTGLIGPELTVLTTSMGLLEAKRSSLNPDLAGLMVLFYKQAGLKAGDQVALGISGSFPGLAIAALCAATELNLDARCIVSLGASTYGATRPELNMPLMLRLLSEWGLIDYRLLAVSPGSDNDEGGNPFFEDSQQVVLSLTRGQGVHVIEQSNLEKNIEERLSLYGDGIACFVNVGGATANIGDGMDSLNFPPGLVLGLPDIPTSPTRGLIFEYAMRGTPVIHLLNIRKLALDYGFPFDPSPLPEPASADFYFRKARRPALLLGAAALALLVIYIGGRAWRRDQKSGVRKDAPLS